MSKIPENKLDQFLKELMETQRRYANEEKNKRSNRQAEVKDLVDKFVAKESRP